MKPYQIITLTISQPGALLACAVGFLSAATLNVEAQPGHVNNGNPNPGIIPIHARYGGLTYEEWVIRWWQWEFDPGTGATSPFCDPEAYFAVGQSGPVWFLPGWSCVGPGERVSNVALPAGKALLLGCPAWGSPVPLSKEYILSVTPLNLVEINLDGDPIKDLDSYYLTTRAFVGTYPDPNIYSVPPGPVTTYAAGVYLLFAPLSAGEHTISFQWKILEGFFAGDFKETYNITVAGDHK